MISMKNNVNFVHSYSINNVHFKNIISSELILRTQI